MEVLEVIRTLVDTFAGVFEKPTGLPLHWGRDHRINLKEGVDPPNVRPYQFLQVQKERSSD